MNIVDPIFVHAHERPNHPAVEDGDRIVTYSELAALVDHAVAELQTLGIKLGDIVVVALPDTAGHVVALFALAKLGAVSFSLDERSLDSEKSRAIEGLIVKAAIVASGAPRFLDLLSIPLDAIIKGTTSAKPAAGAITDLPSFDADQPAMVVQSSGTTGEPKRLFVTHRQLADRNRPRIAMHDLNSAERFLQVPYLRFSWGRDGAIVVIMLGGTIVLNHATTADDYLRYFTDHGITYVTLTPYHLRLIMSRVSANEPLWPRLKIVVASAPLMPSERTLARRRLTPQFVEIYGANEVSTLALAKPEDQDRYPESIGRLVDGIEAQVVDGNGSPLPFGEIGQIRFRGPSYFPREYTGNPEATARQFKDGWFYPGDLAAMNEDGYVFLKGRADDVINNAGAKYFPAEVEAVLSSHPAVAEVTVVGGPHPQCGEVTVAYVVRSSAVSPDELFRFCEGRIAMYKAPYWVFFLDEIPRVPAGKPDKKKLKETFRRYLEAESR